MVATYDTGYQFVLFVLFASQNFANIITSMTARCQRHTIRYEIFIKIIKTSDYNIECFNQEMKGITSVIRLICIKTKIYL